MPGRSAAGLALAFLAFWAGGISCRAASGASAPASSGEAPAVRRPVEDLFLLTGELRAGRSFSIVTPRGEGELQIRWMVDDGTDIGEGDRVVEFDAARLIQNIEERRLRLRQAENELESRDRTLQAEGDRKRVAVDKAEVEAEKARIDAAVPRDLRSAVEWRQMQALFQEKQAALEKARLDQEAFRTSSRSDLEVLRRTEEKARREMQAAEMSLESMSVRAPRNGIFLVGNFWQWGPEGPRKLQPGDTVWPGYDLSTRPFLVYRPRQWAVLLNPPGEIEGFRPYPTSWPQLGVPALVHLGTTPGLLGQLEFDFTVGPLTTVAIPLADNLPEQALDRETQVRLVPRLGDVVVQSCTVDGGHDRVETSLAGEQDFRGLR